MAYADTFTEEYYHELEDLYAENNFDEITAHPEDHPEVVSLRGLHALIYAQGMDGYDVNAFYNVVIRDMSDAEVAELNANVATFVDYSCDNIGCLYEMRITPPRKMITRFIFECSEWVDDDTFFIRATKWLFAESGAEITFDHVAHYCACQIAHQDTVDDDAVKACIELGVRAFVARAKILCNDIEPMTFRDIHLTRWHLMAQEKFDLPFDDDVMPLIRTARRTHGLTPIDWKYRSPLVMWRETIYS